MRFAEWIWQVRGSLALPHGQSPNEAFGRLSPLFHQPGTSYECQNGELTFRKKDPAAQDRMSVFDRGVLQIEESSTGPVLHYRLTSRILLFCFLAPLLFLSFAALSIAAGKFETPAAKQSSKKEDDKKDKVLPQNPIDQFLGAPAPEKPKKDKKKEEDDDDKPDPTPAYVLAGIFAVLYVVGRLLEARLVRSLFKKKLADL
jgi:hypothetical protein